MDSQSSSHSYSSTENIGVHHHAQSHAFQNQDQNDQNQKNFYCIFKFMSVAVAGAVGGGACGGQVTPCMSQCFSLGQELNLSPDSVAGAFTY